MKFVIEYITAKGYRSYFQERIGIMSVMVPDQSRAKIYDEKHIADADRRRYFGTRRNYKTITFINPESKPSAGTIRTGHDSGIF